MNETSRLENEKLAKKTAQAIRFFYGSLVAMVIIIITGFIIKQPIAAIIIGVLQAFAFLCRLGLLALTALVSTFECSDLPLNMIDDEENNVEVLCYEEANA